MTIKINSMEELSNYTDILPTYLLEDINKRITDWLASGGTLRDPYIKQQFRYAENYINYK